MRRKIYEVVEEVLALPRAERAVVMERLKESLEQPGVRGGIIVEPQDLVELGARYVFPTNRRYQGETVTLTSKAGPTLSMKWGALAIADPWFPEDAPAAPAIGMGANDYPTAVIVITRTRVETGAAEALPVAATVGAVAEVVAWQPLADDGQFQLDSDSSLGAFYEITDAAVLQPLFEDDLYMQGIFNRALEESIVSMETDGRTLAAAFLCGKEQHPAWVGFDANGVAVAVLLDFGLLSHAQGREDDVTR
ncbi:hypothetical protein [uncultured Nocardioides sp.]|uniref:hypothetical protein n=1 Tax=uncultured Nocardioides sp. TaxID=198441 RepID=UPI00262FB1B1|nr:hypothetical protein [uncultured Nocardioides sp.]